ARRTGTGGGGRPDPARDPHRRRTGPVDHRSGRRRRPGLSPGLSGRVDAVGRRVTRRRDRRRSPLQVTARRVRGSIRRRLLFANVAGAAAVMTFLQLASGPDLAPNLPGWVRIAGPLLPVVVLLVPGYVWGHR